MWIITHKELALDLSLVSALQFRIEALHGQDSLAYILKSKWKDGNQLRIVFINKMD